MGAASFDQIQEFVDSRYRPRCEQVRNLLASIADDISVIGDIYSTLSGDPTLWNDNRNDVPIKLNGNDVLAMNSGFVQLQSDINKNPFLAELLKGVVRPIL